ncbi:MAG TPA: S-methyl-5'-thioadenosine phosphorylase [Terriglobia bacterium]|jgi:5'-methylthioadenosine phosphorylase|nr:S-methyl-5'-thioadenosine phosphorylase [Terriglobia bacterium]
MKSDVRIGIIGGSGLYQMEGLSNVEEVPLDTPFGSPSDSYRVGTLEGKRVAFLARHNRNHTILPSELNFRANIHGFKQLGAEWILSASAVGSLKENLHPLDIVLPDQFYDRTKSRISTFFGQGIVAHVSFGDPICSVLADVIEASGKDADIPIKRGGTYVCMEGPQFSTKAESNTYRGWGMDLIGMTNLQEAKLAREAEICYTTMALVTDYDCWHPDHDSVTVADIVRNLHKNSENAQKIIKAAVKRLPVERSCKCGSALQHAILTDLKKAPADTRAKLEILLRKYL